MWNRSRLAVALALVVGALGGWLAGSGRLPSFAWAGGPSASGDPPACSGCCEGADRAALAAHNRAVQEKADKNGKKPNILIIWGDDIEIGRASCRERV